MEELVGEIASYHGGRGDCQCETTTRGGSETKNREN